MPTNSTKDFPQKTGIFGPKISERRDGMGGGIPSRKICKKVFDPLSNYNCCLIPNHSEAQFISMRKYEKDMLCFKFRKKG